MEEKDDAIDNKKIILAIDDNAIQLKLFRKTLSPNYNVRLAKSASEAFGLIKEIHVDLFLLDMEMPSISGFEFLHELRKIPMYMSVPVIIVTGHNEPEFLEAANNSSAAGVLIKPVKPQILLETIEKAFSMSPKNPFGL